MAILRSNYVCVVTVIYVMCLSFLHFLFFVTLRYVNRQPRKRTQETNNPVLWCVALKKKGEMHKN